jgi:hypothetical protein
MHFRDSGRAPRYPFSLMKTSAAPHASAKIDTIGKYSSTQTAGVVLAPALSVHRRAGAFSWNSRTQCPLFRGAIGQVRASLHEPPALALVPALRWHPEAGALKGQRAIRGPLLALSPRRPRVHF